MSQTTIDVLTALVIYGVGSTALRVVLYMIREKLREE